MKITVEQTDKTVMIETQGGQVEARIWQGRTSTGIPCYAIISFVASPPGADQRKFARELQKMVKARPDAAAQPPVIRLKQENPDGN